MRLVLLDVSHGGVIYYPTVGLLYPTVGSRDLVVESTVVQNLYKSIAADSADRI